MSFTSDLELGTEWRVICFSRRWCERDVIGVDGIILRLLGWNSTFSLKSITHRVSCHVKAVDETSQKDEHGVLSNTESSTCPTSGPIPVVSFHVIPEIAVHKSVRIKLRGVLVLLRVERYVPVVDRDDGTSGQAIAVVFVVLDERMRESGRIHVGSPSHTFLHDGLDVRQAIKVVERR